MTSVDFLMTLREWLPHHSKVYCILRHVSKSGMSRDIDFYTVVNGELIRLSYHMGKAFPSYFKFAPDGNGIRVKGCGMDVGFFAVDVLEKLLAPPNGDYHLIHCWL